MLDLKSSSFYFQSSVLMSSSFKMVKKLFKLFYFLFIYDKKKRTANFSYDYYSAVLNFTIKLKSKFHCLFILILITIGAAVEEENII